MSEASDDPIIGGRRLSELVAEGMVDPVQAKLTPTAPPLTLPRWRPPIVPMTWPLTVELPLPPTTNNLFINSRGGGRVLSARYRKWKPEAAKHLKRLSRITEYPVTITYRIVWGKGWRSNWDVSNREKAATDALVEGLAMMAHWYENHLPLRNDVRAAANLDYSKPHEITCGNVWPGKYNLDVPAPVLLSGPAPARKILRVKRESDEGTLYPYLGEDRTFSPREPIIPVICDSRSLPQYTTQYHAEKGDIHLIYTGAVAELVNFFFIANRFVWPETKTLSGRETLLYSVNPRVTVFSENITGLDPIELPR